MKFLNGIFIGKIPSHKHADNHQKYYARNIKVDPPKQMNKLSKDTNQNEQVTLRYYIIRGT